MIATLQAKLLGGKSLRALATGAFASIVTSVIITNVLRIVSSMTLTRLLDAEAYGIVGIITSVSYVLAMLSEIGLYAFVVRHKEGDDPAFLDQVWTIRLIRAIGLALAMMAAAKPVALFLGKPEVAPVIAVWSLNFIVDGLSSLAPFTAVRNQQLWRMSLLDLSNSILQFAFSLTAAVVLRSYWALIIGMAGGLLVKLVLSYAMFPGSRRRWSLHRPRMREIWSFSRYMAFSSVLSILILQTDKVVLARLMPLSQYGLYAIATTLAVAPAAIASPYTNRVLFPLFSRTVREEPSALRRVLYGARKRVILLYMFAVGGMIGGASLLVELLYDDRYRGVTPFLQLVTISTAVRFSGLAANEALVALGKTKMMLVANGCRIAWLAAGGAIGIATGNVLLLVACVGTVEVAGNLCFWTGLKREGLLDLRHEAFELAVALAGGAVGYGVAKAGLALLAR